MQTRGKGVKNPKNFADILYELPPFMKFHDRILPEAFRKLLASHATQRWGQEIQGHILTDWPIPRAEFGTG